MKVKEITLSNSSLQNLFTITGEYDVQNSNLDMRIREQRVPLDEIVEYIPLDELDGELLLNGRFGGKLDALAYNLSITSNRIGAKNIAFNNLKILLDGDLKN